MQIYIAKTEQKLGPYTLDEVRSKLACGELSESDLAWHEGLTQWLTLRQVIASAGLPSLLRDQRRRDAQHLKLLSIFHFIGAGLGLLGIPFLFAHYTLFRVFLSKPAMWQAQKSGPPPAEFFAIFKWFYVIMGVWFVISGILNLISGFCLRVRKHPTFSTVVAAINCLHMPLGTVLGVFTIIILQRASVRELYEAQRAVAAGGGGI